MVTIFAKRVKNGKMTLDEVPERWREEVRARLIADGYLIEDDEETEAVDLSAMTKAQLVAYGTTQGVELSMSMTKAEMLAALGVDE